ncbi:unnamed protein product [Danaus chrysippus]|uniref:(African queen) hypothetical protein n=1 Tax=Danaus chrysippus TaxID=151541 RepID=A0A8J2R990_9NEOP|nr:unnamed protein product [Danaus chrysippus]
MIRILVLSSVVAASFARQNLGESRNVVTVPTNCPQGQEWINGMCRDVWRSGVTPPSVSWGNPVPRFANIITVPPHCPPGEVYVHGKCREIWRDGGSLPNSNLYNGLLESLWSEHVRKLQQSPRNFANIPSQCPIGFQADAFGNCYPIKDE